MWDLAAASAQLLSQLGASGGQEVVHAASRGHLTNQLLHILARELASWELPCINKAFHDSASHVEACMHVFHVETGDVAPMLFESQGFACNKCNGAESAAARLQSVLACDPLLCRNLARKLVRISQYLDCLGM